MERFTQENLKDVRVKINDALKSLEADIGIRFSIGNIRFDASSFTTKLTAEIVYAGGVTGRTTADAIGSPETQPTLQSILGSASDLQSWHPNDYLGKKLLIKGVTYTIVGYKSSRPKYPFVFTNPAGTQFKGSFTMVKDAIKEYNMRFGDQK